MPITPITLRWIDDGNVNFQSIIIKSVSNDNGSTWSTPATIYDDTAHPPPGFGGGRAISDLSAGLPVAVGYAIDMSGPSGGQNQWIFIPSDSSTSPIVVDGTNRPASQGGFSTYRNTWVDSNGNLWLVAFSPVLHTTVVYKSTDSGATWTLMDQGNAIPVASTGNWFWDEVGNKIQFIRADGSGFMQLQEFDISTGLYTTPHDSNTGGPTGWGGGLVLVSGSVIFNVYVIAGVCSVSIFSGGSWTTPGPLNFGATDTGVITTGQIDANGTAHLITGTNPGSGPAMVYRNCTSGGVLGTAHNFPQGAGLGDLTGSANDAISIPYIDNANDTIVINARGFNPSNGGLVPLIFQGTPLSNPTWTGPIAVWGSLTAEYYGGMMTAPTAPPPPSISCRQPPRTP